MDWLNAAAEALGREGVEVSPFDFRHGGGDTTVGLQLRDAPVPLIYLRIALIQVRARFYHAICGPSPLIDRSIPNNPLHRASTASSARRCRCSTSATPAAIRWATACGGSRTSC